MKQYPAWGVDLTAVAVRGVQLALTSEGKPRVNAWDVVDFTEQVPDVSSLARFNVMERGLHHFRSRHHLEKSRVWYSLRAETAFNRSVQVPPVNDEGVGRLLELEAQQQIPFPPEEIFWDSRVLGIREGGEVSATLYAIKRTLVEDRLRKIQKAGLPVDGLQLRPIALQNFCTYERLLEEGTVVIDIDYAGMQILIHHDEQTWFRVLPVGGGDFTNLIERTFQVPHAAAVRMATGEADPPDAKRLETLRRKVVQDLTQEAERLVTYYRAARTDVDLKRIVLFESHPCVPSCEAALGAALRLPVVVPRGFRYIEVDPEVVSAGIQDNFPALAKAAGLALQGLGRADCQVRLFPPTLERRIGGGRAGYVAAAGLLGLVVLVAALREKALAGKLQNEVEAAESVLGSVQRASDIEAAAGLDSVDATLTTLAKPLRDQAFVRSVTDHLWRVAAKWPGEESAVLASVDIEATRKVSVLLAAAATTEAAADARLQKLAQTFVDAANCVSVTPGEAFTASSVTPIAPGGPPTELLRYPVRHRRFDLKFAEVQP